MQMHSQDSDLFVSITGGSVSFVQERKIRRFSRRSLYRKLRDGRFHTISEPMDSQPVPMESVKLHWLERF